MMENEYESMHRFIDERMTDFLTEAEVKYMHSFVENQMKQQDFLRAKAFPNNPPLVMPATRTGE